MRVFFFVFPASSFFFDAGKFVCVSGRRWSIIAYRPRRDYFAHAKTSLRWSNRDLFKTNQEKNRKQTTKYAIFVVVVVVDIFCFFLENVGFIGSCRSVVLKSEMAAVISISIQKGQPNTKWNYIFKGRCCCCVTRRIFLHTPTNIQPTFLPFFRRWWSQKKKKKCNKTKRKKKGKWGACAESVKRIGACPSSCLCCVLCIRRCRATTATGRAPPPSSPPLFSCFHLLFFFCVVVVVVVRIVRRRRPSPVR